MLFSPTSMLSRNCFLKHVFGSRERHVILFIYLFGGGGLLSNNKLDVYMTVINVDIKHQRRHNTAEQRMQKAVLSVAYLETVNVNRFYQKEMSQVLIWGLRSTSWSDRTNH